MSTTKNKVLVFMLAFLMVFTAIPPSYASDEVVKIETLTARLTKGASKVGDDWVWKATGNSAGHRFVYRVTYAISGTREYEPGKVEIRIPKQVLLDRENNFADTYEMSIPSYDDPELTESDTTTKYVYKEDGDDIVIYNRIAVPGGDNGYFEVGYDMSKRTFEYADYGAESDESGPFKATMKISQGETTATKDTDETYVYIDTEATINRTTKSVSAKYNSWSNSWGEAPADADDYYYIVWQVRTWINTPTQPYNFRIVDTFDQTVEGEVVGYRYQGESRYTDNHWVQKQTHYSENDRYDYVLTKYSKAQFVDVDYYELKNNVVATVDPYDEVDPDTTAYSNAAYRWEKPKYVKPTGHFDSEKRGNDYRDYYVYSSDDIRSFKLTDFQKEKINRIDNLKYSTWTVGYQWPWTLQGDWQNPDNYGKKKVKTVIWDNEWYLNKTDGSEYEESEKLTKDDFELKKITFNWSASNATFNEETQGFSQITPTYTSSDYVDFYGEFDGTWRKVASYNPETRTFSNLASSYYLKNASRNTIEFGANCTGWKAEYTNKFFRVELAVDPYVDLKDSAKVKEGCAEKDKVSLLNVMHSEMYDSGNNKIVGFTEKGTDYIIGINRHGHIRKYVNSYKNNKVKKNYSVNWRMNAWEDFRDANASITDVAQESGIFYDLVPLGGEVDLSSVKAYKAKSNFSNGENVAELDPSDYDVEIKKNYKDSGRDLLIVKIKTEGEKGYQVRYTSVHSWENIKDTGNVFLNEVAYETGNEDMGDAGPDNGGSLRSKDIMTNLNPNVPDTGNVEKFMYASSTHTADILTSANLGLLKKVKDSFDEDYSYKTITKPNGEYSYKIRFATDDETRARDLMLFDSLENYVVQEAGQDSHTSDWHGKLQSVDLSVVKKLGIAPVVYLSSVENLDLSVAANHDLSNSTVWKKADQFGNIENAKAVAVDMRYKADGSEYILPKDTGVSVTLNMKAPEGLEIDKEHIYAFNNIYLNDIAIDANDTEEHFYVHQDYTQIEYRVSAPVKITKVNAKDHSEKVKDMTFSLTGTSDYGTEVNESGKSDRNGYVDFEGIEKGTYILKETKTNDDWLLNGQAYTVNIDYRGNVTIEGLEKDGERFLFENQPRIHGDLQFRKKSLGQDEETLKVIEKIKNITPGSSETISINGHNFYILANDNQKRILIWSTEAVRIPDAYSLMPATEAFSEELFSDSPIINNLVAATKISQLKPQGSFKYTIDVPGRRETTQKFFALSVVDFQVKKEWNFINETDFTYGGKPLSFPDLSGIVRRNTLLRDEVFNSGAYAYMCEITPSANVYRNFNSRYENCSKNGYVYPAMWLDISNTKPQLNIPNTTFKLEGTSDYGTEITEYLTSNSVGRVTLENLEKGTYTLTETKANPDYIKNPDTWKVIVDENGQVTVDGAKTLENGEQYLENEPYHQMNLRKVDADDNNRWLEGAEFTLTGTSDYGTKVDMTDTSRNTGRVTFDMLESGTYVLKETKPPKNYQHDTKEYLVEIDKNGNVTIDGLSEVDDDGFILFPNEKSFEGKIKITKKWKDGKTGEEAANRPEPVITISTKEEDAFKGHVLTYDANGKTFANGKTTNRVRVFQQSGDKIEDSIVDGTYKEPVDPSEDYVFRGWYFDKECTQPMVDTTFLTQDRTVYAKWEKKAAYAVFDSSDGSLTFFRDDPQKYSQREVIGTKTYYTGIEVMSAKSLDDIPWRPNIPKIQTVNFQDKISPISTAWWFRDMSQLDSIINIEKLDTSKVTDMSYMFHNCYAITRLDLSNLDTSNVTNMGYMFYKCLSLTTLDLSHFDTSSVTNMECMFQSCDALTTIDVSNFDTSKVENMRSIFSGCQSLITLDLSNFDTSKLTYIGGMFAQCRALTTLDVSNFDTSNVTNMAGMFNGCSSLTTLDVSHFDTSKVTYIYMMFDGCSSLTALDVSHFDTSNVTDMRYMFRGCSSLMTLGVSHFDTSKVTYIYMMFDGCSSLTALDVSHFDTSNVTDMRYMFRNCSSLTTTLNIMSMPQYYYEYMCEGAATAAGAQITLKYINPVTSANIDTLVATKSSDGNVINGGEGTFTPPDTSGVWNENNPSPAKKTSGTSSQNVSGKTTANKILTSKITAKEGDNKTENAVTSKKDDSKTLTSKSVTNKPDTTDNLMSAIPKLTDNPLSALTDEAKAAEGDVMSGNYLGVDYRLYDDGSGGYILDLGNPDVKQTYTGQVRMDLSTGTVPWIRYAPKVTTINFIGDVVAYSDTSCFFNRYINLSTINNADRFDVSNVTNMSRMFYETAATSTSFEISGLDNWDTSNVTNMSEMFRGAGRNTTSFTISGLDNWGTSNVTNMSEMFSGAGEKATAWSIGDLSNWDVGNVTSMYRMFYSAGYTATNFNLGDLSDWDVSKVINMEGLFGLSGRNATTWYVGTLSNWDVHNVQTMGSIFYAAGKNANVITLDLSNWDISNVTTLAYAFNSLGQNNDANFSIGDISNWDTGNVTSLSRTFSGISPLFDFTMIENWDVSNVENLEWTFRYANTDHLDLSNWDVSKNKNWNRTFGDVHLNWLDISTWDTTVAENQYWYHPFAGIDCTDNNSSNTRIKAVALGPKALMDDDDPITKNTRGDHKYVRYATLDGRNVYTEDEIKKFSDYNGSKPGWYKLADVTAFNESELYDAYSTADDQSKWVKESDDTWTYTFDVHDDEAKYYVWEDLLEGYDSDTYKIDYQIINDPDNPDVNVKEATITNTQENIPPEREETMPGSLKLSKTVKGHETTKYSHTPNISDDGTQNGDYPNRANQNEVVTIPGATKLNVKIIYSGEGTEYDWVCVWEGDHPTYTAYNDHPASISGKLGGRNRATKEYIIDGDTVTFGFRSDGGGVGDGYGYYAEVIGTNITEQDFTKNFTFNVELSGLEGTKIVNGVVFKEGKGTVHLKHGEEFEFTDLPAGTTYKVTEAEQDDYNVTFENNQGTINGNKTVTAAFTNTKKSKQEQPRGGFKLIKQVKGNLGDLFENFTFNIAFSKLSANAEYEFSDGTTFTSDENGMAEAEVKLKSGDEVTIDGLPVGAKYKVTELRARYTASYEITEGTGRTDSIVQPKDSNDELWVSLSTRNETVDEGEDITVKFTNTREKEPTTGYDVAKWWLYALILLLIGQMYVEEKYRRRFMVRLHD